ncbi:MAG: hypothetical protein PF541_05610 [Prolixibacteraceae bacterium]|jgi:hypothetical protein|nr:hypothetical protein [Prolixibacteraceae bacterium]
MDDLIPFLIVIAISIVGAASRKKKKRSLSKNISAPQQATRKDDFLSWMEKLSGEDESEDPYEQSAAMAAEVEPVKEAVDTKKYEPISSRTDLYKKHQGVIGPEEKAKSVKKETSHFVKSKVESEENIQTIKESEIGNKESVIDFDLRKAIVFTEILNRKYS